ncbi:HNH endonuclease signature motif containing protein [Bradyrhizobium sp. BR 10289]|uniref:HNH endonuclease n=1 Tax=Bradyrhizobium sp. BR 10289 TaxID=2749993 RepID=UPI001C647DE5|nr:HNH endonuclease signature motif containing protein [Bradyrhizobium sp. BR 10289]MBW7968131.1 HNH endonuclease [Bradyrhizobium sp. BR 10289]
MPDARHIPEAVKRAVRQHCKFGCAICGSPIWDYDHIDDFAEGGTHDPDNLILLCPNHHGEKTRGMLDRELVRSFRATPTNAKNEMSGVRTILRASDQSALILGETILTSRIAETGYFTGIWVNGHILLGYQIEDGRLLLDMTLTTRDGNVVFEVCGGEARVSTGVWDVNWVGNTLSVRSTDHQIDTLLTFGHKAIRVYKGLFVDRQGCGVEVLSEHRVALLCNMRPMSWFDGAHLDGGSVSFALLERNLEIEPPKGVVYLRGC